MYNQSDYNHSPFITGDFSLNKSSNIFSNMDPLSIGTLALSGVGSIFGGFLGSNSSKNTNKTNLQIARETNEANRANQEYQNEWNYNMWNMQNEYNTPLNQRKRLDEAGLNPIFSGLDGTGNAGALQSAPFTAVNGAPMENSGAFMQQGLLNAATSLADAKLKISQSNNLDQNTQFQGQQTKAVTLQNEITEANKGVIISVGNLQLPVTQALLDGYKKQPALYQKQIENLEAQTNSLNESLQLAKDRFTFEQYSTIVDQYLSSLKIDRDYEIALKKIAIDSYVAGSVVELNNSMALYYTFAGDNQASQAQKNEIEAGIKALDFFYYNQDRDIRINNTVSQTIKNSSDAAFGSTIVGGVLRGAATVAQGLRKVCGKTSIEITSPHYLNIKPADQPLVK